MNVEMIPHDGKAQVLDLNNHIPQAITEGTPSLHQLLMRSQEFTSKTFPINHRQRLLGATVSLALLHAAGIRTLTEKMKRPLNAAQRRMIRMNIVTP